MLGAEVYAILAAAEILTWKEKLAHTETLTNWEKKGKNELYLGIYKKDLKDTGENITGPRVLNKHMAIMKMRATPDCR